MQRQRAVAAWASMTGVAAVLGNVGGGAAIQYGGWRALFWFVVPLSIGAIALAAIAAPVTTRHDRPADVPATVLLTSGFLALLYAIVSAPRFGWLGRPVLGSAAIAVVLLAAWVWHELHSTHPLLDPRLFAIPSVRAGALGMAALFVGMFGLFYLNGQFLQYVQGDSPLGSGVRLLPMAAALLAGPRCGLVVERGLGTRAAMAGGMAVLACGLATVSSVGPHSPYVLYAAGACLTALGCGIATPVLSHAMLGALPPGRSGVGSGLQSLVRELGSALGVAVCGTVTTAVFTAHLPTSLRGPTGPTTVAAALTHPVPRAAVLQAFTDGLHAATLGLAGAVALAAVLITVWLPSNQD
jgi:predicted MFS family arabinose efflux permease